jgi:hypothetical protein
MVPSWVGILLKRTRVTVGKLPVADVAVYSAKTVFCRDTRAYTIVMLLYIVSLLSRKATWVDILFAAAAAARPVAFWNLLSMNDLGVLDDIFYRHFVSFLLTPIMDDGTQMHHI